MTTTWPDVLAFRNPDGSLVLALQNDGDKERRVRVKIGTVETQLMLPALINDECRSYAAIIA